MSRRLPLSPAEKLIVDEDHIVLAGISDPEHDLSWLNSSAFRSYLGAWGKLVDEYTTGENTVISLDVVTSYLQWTDRLKHLAVTVTDERLRDLTVEAQNQLEGHMFEIRKEASRTANNLEDKS